ncbi:hypothetical protein V2A60_001591 [Cordyceps javanica]|uniref:Uncharacterized protein n=1 Tax=Cordyceps javanica TaxID=43265 RepID=A0A545VFL3_9HYPO|nr:hypothetical protein IF1G_00443 [Cordyceps javanica]TQW11695.1 hypothetical protein IF2G_00426 [Cordyceps javanica]
MATFAKLQPATSAIHRRYSHASNTSSLPEYELGDYAQFQRLTVTASQSESSSLPDYDTLDASTSASSAASAVASFNNTSAFQIDTAGHPLFYLPLPPKAIPIPIFRVQTDGTVGELAYESLRNKRSSGSCALVRAGHDVSEAPVCSTTYRFGPGKNPQIQLHGRLDPNETYEAQGKGLTTRAQSIRTHLGTFEWRYASRSDRKALGASSLLLFERVTTVALAGGKSEERRSVLGMFVRNAELRTHGTHGCTAGNGGRLLLNLTEWADAKVEHEQMEILAISSCIMMLKKEIDRRRVQQFMMMNGGGGGP